MTLNWFGLVHEHAQRAVQGAPRDAVCAESKVKVFGSVPRGDALQTVGGADGGNVSSMDSTVYFVSSLWGLKDVTTTQIYTHVMKKPGIGVKSPLDSI